MRALVTLYGSAPAFHPPARMLSHPPVPQQTLCLILSRLNSSHPRSRFRLQQERLSSSDCAVCGWSAGQKCVGNAKITAFHTTGSKPVIGTVKRVNARPPLQFTWHTHTHREHARSTQERFSECGKTSLHATKKALKMSNKPLGQRRFFKKAAFWRKM